MRRLTTEGIVLEAAKRGRDMRIDAIEGPSRPVTVAKYRHVAGTIRAGRVRQIARVGGARASTLMRSGAIPNERGVQLRLVGHRQKCYSAAVALGYGQEADPSINSRIEQPWEWASIRCTITSQVKGGCLLPGKTASALLRERGRWKRVNGVMGATLAALRDMGWDPDGPGWWSPPPPPPQGLTLPQTLATTLQSSSSASRCGDRCCPDFGKRLERTARPAPTIVNKVQTSPRPRQ